MDTVRYKILLVEDNQLDQMAFKRFVKKNAIPYDCTVSGSVSEARQVLGAKEFDIIIADHSLGDGTALDILELAPSTPVIVVTGAGDEETAVKAWKAGAYDYLVKDVTQNYLKAIPITVENAIRHKVIEKKLQLLSGAVMSTEDSVYITDMQGNIIFVNKAFCRSYGYTEEEIVGENGNILWIDKCQSNNTRSVFQTKAAGSSWEVGFYHRRKDDSVFPVSLSRSHVKDSHGNGVAIVGVARDITDRILVEDEMRTASHIGAETKDGREVGWRSERFAETFNTGMHKCIAFAEDKTLQVSMFVKGKLQTPVEFTADTPLAYRFGFDTGFDNHSRVCKLINT